MKNKLKDGIYYNNGSLKDFRIENLIEKVKENKESIHSLRTDNYGNTYFIVVGGSFDTNLKTGENATLEIIVEYEDGNQDRILKIRKASNWDEIIKAFNSWKATIRDSRKMRDDEFNEVFRELNARFKRTRFENIEYYVTILESGVEAVLKVTNDDDYDNLVLSEEIPLILDIELMTKKIIKLFNKLIEQARYELQQKSLEIDYALKNLSKLDFR